MNPSEYRYQIEKVYSESLSVFDWLLTDEQFEQFVLIAKACKSGGMVLDNWKIFLNGGGCTPEGFYEWWMEYRPDKLEGAEEKTDQPINGKKDLFAEVKKKVRMK